MVSASATTQPIKRPDPVADRPNANAAPNQDLKRPSAQLRGLLQNLIEFAKSLLATLQAPLETQSRFDIACRFGTTDIARIIARITRALMLARALDDRLVVIAPSLDNPPSRPAKPKPASTRARGPAIKPKPEDSAGSLASLPTAEEIAELIRRQPIGRVIADICRDLGIDPSHELWRPLQLAIVTHGGSLVRYMQAILRRLGTTGFDLAPVLPISEPYAPPDRIATGPP